MLATKPDDLSLIHGNYMVGKKLLPNCPPCVCNGKSMSPHINKCKNNHHHHLVYPTSLVQPWGAVTRPCFCSTPSVSHVLGGPARSFSWSSLPSSLLLPIILYPCAFICVQAHHDGGLRVCVVGMGSGLHAALCKVPTLQWALGPGAC